MQRLVCLVAIGITLIGCAGPRLTGRALHEEKTSSTRAPGKSLSAREIESLLVLFDEPEGERAAKTLAADAKALHGAYPRIRDRFRKSLTVRVKGPPPGSYTGQGPEPKETAFLRRSCLLAFRSLGSLASESTVDLLDLLIRRELEGEDGGALESIELTIAATSAEHPDLLGRAVGHESRSVRRSAARAMGYMRGSVTQVRPMLERMLEDSDHTVAMEAVSSLGKLDAHSSTSIKILQRRLRREKADLNRELLERIIEQLVAAEESK